MRRKVMCTTQTPTGAYAALLVAQLDLTALVLLDGPEALAEDLVSAAAALRYEPRVRAGGWPEAAGADLVVLDVVDDEMTQQLAARCAGAVIVLATATPVADVERVLDGTRLPRSHVLGAAVDGAGPITAAARATEIVDAILRDRRATLRCAVRCQGEGGAEGVHLREARVGAGGVHAIL
jgi:malate/lactate dehydrogenase